MQASPGNGMHPTSRRSWPHRSHSWTRSIISSRLHPQMDNRQIPASSWLSCSAVCSTLYLMRCVSHLLSVTLGTHALKRGGIIHVQHSSTLADRRQQLSGPLIIRSVTIPALPSYLLCPGMNHQGCRSSKIVHVAWTNFTCTNVAVVESALVHVPFMYLNLHLP